MYLIEREEETGNWLAGKLKRVSTGKNAISSQKIPSRRFLGGVRRCARIYANSSRARHWGNP
jgi:hypothetical protein